MFKKNGKLVAGLLLSTGLLVACSGGSGAPESSAGTAESETSEGVAQEGLPIVEDQLELTLMAPSTGTEWSDMPALQEYEGMTNIALKYNNPPLSDFETRFNLSFASGELPDFYLAPTGALTPAMEVDYGTQGLLLPLNDLIDNYAPNLKQILEERPDARQSITTPDGNIYALPTISEEYSAAWVTGPIWYNGEWLDALDAEVPKTLDEFYDLLVRFRDNDQNGNGEQDEIPLSGSDGMTYLRQYLVPSFGIKKFDMEEKDGEVRYAPASEDAREYYKFMNKLYEEKLLDQEVFSQSGHQKKAKGESDRLGVYHDWFSYFTSGKEEEEAVTDPMFHPLTSEWQAEPVAPIKTGITRSTAAITTANEHPEATMRWLDGLYDPEIANLMSVGPEGHVWELDENGKRQYTEAAKGDVEEVRSKVAPNYGLEFPGYHQDKEDYDGPDLTIGDEENPFLTFVKQETADKIDPYGEVPLPDLYLSQEEIDKTQAIIGDLETFIEQEEAKFITGQKDINDDAVWEQYLQEIESMGLDTLVEAYQAAYNRWVEAGEQIN